MDKLEKIEGKDCRAIQEKFFNKLEGEYVPFVELVKVHPELILCFRGNNKRNKKPDEKLCIYRDNHVMFSFTSEMLFFNPNYLRYCSDWEDKLRDFINKFGFNEVNEPVLKPITKSEKREYYSTKFSTEELSRKIDKNLLDNLEYMYAFLTKIFDDYFDDNNKKDRFLEWGLINRNFDDDIEEEKLKDFIDTRNKKFETEKARQQQLFTSLKEQKNGYFAYDLEFQQPHNNSTERDADKVAGISNKPDMLAIRFASGKPAALVFVEVKSTYEACSNSNKSGVKKHIASMEIYPDKRLDCRRKEAYLIMDQYRRLGLIDLHEPLEWKNYKNLPLEKILIFTNGAKE